MNWINKKDKLPKLNTQVIVIVTNNKANVAYLKSYKGELYFIIQTISSSYRENDMHRVTHWSYIPEPPILLGTTENEYKEVLKHI